MMAARWAGVAAVIAGALVSVPSAAMFAVPRYAVCHAARGGPPLPPDRRVPLLTRRPKVLDGAELVVIDVAQVAPIPGRSREEGSRRLVAQSAIDFRCVGLPKAMQTIRDIVSAPPGTRWQNKKASDWRALHLRAAGAFGVSGTRRAIRRELARPLPAGPITSRHFEAFRVKLAAAHAAADLNDTGATSLVLAFLKQREGQPAPQVWEEGLGALMRLDPTKAQDYATAVVRRLHDPGERRAHPNMVRHVVALITRPNPRTLVALRTLSAQLIEPDGDPDGTDACRVLAARIRAGDTALAAELRPELGHDLRTQRGALCYSLLVDEVFPGRASAELPVLTHRQRYDSLLRLVERMASSPDADWPRHRRALRQWLKKQARTPRVGGGKSHRDYQPSTRARHLTLQAAMGDERAREQLLGMIVDRNAHGASPFVAARLGLRFGLLGVADAAAVRMRLAIAHHHDHFGRDPWGHRGRLVITEHVRLMEAMRAAGDARFALGLLDHQIHTRAATAFALMGFKGDRAAACQEVLRAADIEGAQDDAIDSALWALSAYGRTCLPEVRRSTRHGGPRVRGMATELLAMLHHHVPTPVPTTTPSRLKTAFQRAAQIQRVPWPAP